MFFVRILKVARLNAQSRPNLQCAVGNPQRTLNRRASFPPDSTNDPMTTTANQQTKRIEPRYTVKDDGGLVVAIRRKENGNGQEVIKSAPLDISYHGVKLSASQSLPFGEQVELIFQSIHLEFSFTVDAEVRWIRQGDDQSWLIGCSLNDRLTNENLDAIAAAGGVERRQYPRKETEVQTNIQVAGNPTPFPVTVLDFSNAGLRFSTDQPIEPEQSLKLLLSTKDGETHEVGAVSHWYMPYESGYFVGCEVVGKHRDVYEKWHREIPRKKGKSSRSQWLALVAALLLVSVLAAFWILK